MLRQLMMKSGIAGLLCLRRDDCSPIVRLIVAYFTILNVSLRSLYDEVVCYEQVERFHLDKTTFLFAKKEKK